MSRLPVVVVLFCVAVIAVPVRAEDEVFVSPIQAAGAGHTNALEIAIAAGSAQTYGTLAPHATNVQTFGVGLDLAAMWRINPRWAVGAYGNFGMFPSTGSAESSWSYAAGLQANYHFDVVTSPWIGLGAGWHGYSLAGDGGRTAYQGVDVARLQAGLTFAVSPNFSVDPVIGLTLTTFLSEKGPAATSYADVQSKDLSIFVLAGALARFDLFGSAPSATAVAAR